MTPHAGSANNRDWSKVYWFLAVNQWLVLAALTLFAGECVRASREACEEFDLALPVMSRAVLYTVGPIGVWLVGGLGAVVIAGLGTIRTQRAAPLASSCVFIAVVVFLLFAFCWSYLPLLSLMSQLRS